MENENGFDTMTKEMKTTQPSNDTAKTLSSTTVCWQTILMKYHTFFFRKLGKMSENLSSAAVVIGALRVKRPARANKHKGKKRHLDHVLGDFNFKDID